MIAQLNGRAHGRPRIGQLLHTLNVGGAEVLAARMARQLRDHFAFTFFCLDELGALGEQLRDERFPVHVLERRPGLDWRCAYRLATLLRQERVDVLHAHQYTPFFYGLSARLLGDPLGRRPPVLLTEHGRHHPDYPRRKRMLVNRLLIERRDRVVAVGGAVRQALVHNEGIPERRVQVIYNGVDLTPFAQAVPERAALRRSLGLPADEFVIIQVARLDYLKDHATAVRTMDRLVRALPSARLLIVGEGPERQAIAELVRQRGLERHVEFLGLRRDVSLLLQASDAFLLTSISEGIPLTIIEAMAAALPVVATQVGGVGEIVENGRTGLLAPSGDDDTLARHLLALAANPEKRQELGKLGRDRAHALFAEPRMMDGYGRLYEEMTRGRR